MDPFVFPRGTEIAPAGSAIPVWVYIATVVGFFLACALAHLTIRVIVKLLQAAILCACPVLLCIGLSEQRIVCWEQLALAVAILAFCAVFSVLLLNVFLIDPDKGD